MPDRREPLVPYSGQLPPEFKTFGPYRYIVVPVVTANPRWVCPLCAPPPAPAPPKTIVGKPRGKDTVGNDDLRTKITEHLGDVHLLGVSAVKAEPTRITDNPRYYKRTCKATATVSCNFRTTADGPTCGAAFSTIDELVAHAASAGHTGPQLKVGTTYMTPKVPPKLEREHRLRAIGLAPPANLPDDIFFGPGPHDTFKRCVDFRYLGRITDPHGDDASALRTRLAIAGKTAGQLLGGPLKRACRAVRLEVWNAVVKAQLVYGSETWYIREHERRLIGRFEAKWLRRVAHMPPRMTPDGLRYPTTAEVRAKLFVPPLIDIIDRSRLRFLGHILRKHGSEALTSLSHRLCMPGRPSIAASDSLRAQLFDILRSAGLKVRDAQNRVILREEIERR